MEPPSEATPTTEIASSPSIVPREIQGIDEPIRQESLGGNAGHMAMAINAVYTGSPDQEFAFTNHPDRDFGRHNDVTFRLQFPEHLVEDLKQGRTPPPALIRDVITDAQGEKRALFERRALEHNTAELLKYLRKGGTINDIIDRGVVTSFVPGANEINRLLAESGKDQEAQTVPNPSRQRKIIAYGLTGARGILNAVDVPITQADHDAFMARVKRGAFNRTALDQMLSTITDPKRKSEYADQFELLKRASGVSEEVFEGKLE